MSTPHADLIVDVEVEGVNFKTIGRSEPYEGQELTHKSGKTRNAIGNEKRYIVRLVNDEITEIVIDYSKLEEAQRKQAEADRMREVAQDLEDATTISITWIGGFHDHTPTLSEANRTEKALAFLRKASERIESSKTAGEFALLVTDLNGDKGSGQSVWRLCGRITGRVPSRGIVNVLLWHYGPGSRH